jgi:large conductance mechanosensitive channel
MTKFASEFKTFVNRGNVVDMSVGVIVGSAFTAIVTAVSNSILMPLINWLLSLIFRTDTLNEIHTFLKTVYVVDESGLVTEEIDLAQSIYIDWGALIHAILNFFLIALVLFTIVKIINKFREEHKEFTKKINEKTLSRADRKELKAAGIKRRDKEAVKAYFDEKKRLAEEKQKAEAEKAEEAKRREREANPTTEDLLKLILAEMKAKD